MSHDPAAALRLPDYRFFLLARISFTLAMQIQAVVVGWQIYELTKDPLALGLIGLTEAVPALTMAPFGGHFADRHRRKPIVLGALIFLFFASLTLTTLAVTLGSDPQSVPYLYGVIFFTGLARGLLSPAFVALLAQIMPRELYANAATWNSVGWQGASVIGPAVGGFVYGFFGLAEAYALDATLVGLAACSFFFVTNRPAPDRPQIAEPMLQSLSVGVRYAFKKQEILGAISLDLFAVLFGGAVALLPVFAKEVLSVGPEGLGLLRMAPAVGAVVMAVILMLRPPMRHSGWVLLYSVAGFGACMILFALSTDFYFSLFMLALSGAFDNVSVVIRSTILQSLTPDHMRGRVAAVNTMFIGSSNEIGAFESGVAARLLGLVPSVIFGGTMTLLVVVTTALRAPKLRDLHLGDLNKSPG